MYDTTVPWGHSFLVKIEGIPSCPKSEIPPPPPPPPPPPAIAAATTIATFMNFPLLQRNSVPSLKKNLR